MDMVSQAGAMALAGLLPVVHSFACFLTPRPNEQIYNNATEGTRVIYAGSLVGLVPAGPGHSHQSVRDIALMGSVPGMSLIEPCNEHQAREAIAWAVREAPGSTYIRLISVPWDLGFELPEAPLVAGQGQVVREGSDGLIVAAGPVLLSQAWEAAEILAGEGKDYGIAALPWLRDIDGEWLGEVRESGPIVCLDNHYLEGGQGDAVLRAVAAAGIQAPVLRFGVDEIPRCGDNHAVLREHRLDGASIAERISSYAQRPG
jgi:transketolase